MKITIQYTAQARRQAGCDQEILELKSPASLEQLFAAVCERHGPAMERILLDHDKRPGATVAVFVNDAQVNRQSPPEFSDGQRVLILCPISGG